MVDDFLLNVKNRIKRSDIDFIIMCGFSLENIQPSLFENEEPIAGFDTGQPNLIKLVHLMTIFILV